MNNTSVPTDERHTATQALNAGHYLDALENIVILFCNIYNMSGLKKLDQLQPQTLQKRYDNNRCIRCNKQLTRYNGFIQLAYKLKCTTCSSFLGKNKRFNSPFMLMYNHLLTHHPIHDTTPSINFN